MWEKFKNDPRWSKEGILLAIWEAEGGKKSSNHKNDVGGATGAGGLTMKLAERYRYLWSKYGFNGDYKKVPMGLVLEIYDLEFWQKLYLDDIWNCCPIIADTMMQWAVNSGNKYPGKALQRFLNLSNNMQKLYPDILVDGWLGPKTVGTLNTFLSIRKVAGIKQVALALYSEQYCHYANFADKREEQETFFAGWNNRIIHTIDDAILFAEEL